MHLCPTRPIDIVLDGHTETSNIHTGDNVTKGRVDRQGNNANEFRAGQVISIFTFPNRSKEVSKAILREKHEGLTEHAAPNIPPSNAEISRCASTDHNNTKLLVVLFTPATKDINENHPLVRCMKNCRFKAMPGFKGFSDLKYFSIMHLTPIVEIWSLSDVSGHAMLVTNTCDFRSFHNIVRPKVHDENF